MLECEVECVRVFVRVCTSEYVRVCVRMLVCVGVCRSMLEYVLVC